MSNFSVGDRCQWEDRDSDEVTGGTIESIMQPKVMRPNNWWTYSETERQDFITYATVKWDDGTTDTVDMDDLDKEDSQLEREFRNEAKAHLDDILDKANAASRLLQEAVDLSEKYGIPFQSPVSFLGQSYFPDSFDERYKGMIDTDFVYSVTNASSEYGYGGWEHSDVC